MLVSLTGTARRLSLNLVYISETLAFGPRMM